MEHESGDDCIRRTAEFIRDNEARLAQAGLGRRKAQSLSSVSMFNPLGWVGLADGKASQPPVILSLDTHRLFYLLMRLEALSIDVGTLDVQVDDLSHPLSYISLGLNNDKSDTLSIADSFRSSLSAVSRLSLGAGWWGKPEPRSVEVELKYIYSSFTKLPALSLCAPGPKMIAELSQDPPMDSAIPLDSFKNLRSLECLDVDPRALLGWDRLAESLRSLTIKRSGLDDPTHIFSDAVLDDQMRREGDVTRSRVRKLGNRASHGFHSSNLPETVQEEAEDSDHLEDSSLSSPLVARLSPLKWAFLKHLCLADNALTSIPNSLLSALTSLTNFDLSSNLLVSIPSLSVLYNLISLNLSDNMIDSVLGIYTKLGQVLTLNLSRNRLDSLCGLERLMALERIDLRHNLLEESAEVGRLAVLPNIAEIWIEGNQFTEIEENYRVRCYDYFAKEGKTIVLDGSLPGFYERRSLSIIPPEEMYTSRIPAAPYTPPTIPTAVTVARAHSPLLSSASSSTVPSPGLAAVAAKPKKRRHKRLVALDGESDYRSSDEGHSAPHTRVATAVRDEARSKSPHEATGTTSSGNPQDSETPDLLPSLPSLEKMNACQSRHGRHRSEYVVPSSPPADGLTLSSPLSGGNGSLGRRAGTLASTKRRNRVSASVYEPPASSDADTVESAKQLKDADVFRARIEALRAEMGDNWLQVLSQSQFGSDQPSRR
ncbi:hypothetical protein EW145_g1284 [Phellinidium pouzarii]|uniref:Uncharacterized protein n=1 Tax=Phellinidium pouzarii TaxID=167371 RepID=A0A4S4LF36_9AGAM|nr:hypothetical protein EW145_g1284 [Phellinidium pouzarii]